MVAAGHGPDPDPRRRIRKSCRCCACCSASKRRSPTSDRAAWLALISVNADPDVAGEFFDAALPRGVTRAVVRERDRVPLDGALPGDGYRLIVEVFVESGPRGQLSTWRLDIRRPSGTTAVAGETDTPWRIVAHDRLSQVDALHRLGPRSRARTTRRKDFVLTSVDFELRLPAGQRLRRQHRRRRLGAGPGRRRPADLQADAQDRAGPGAAVRRRRRPRDPRSSRPTCGSAPTTSSSTSSNGTLTAAAPDARLFTRAREIFDEEVAKSFSLDLSDMSRDIWSILPQPGDMVAEVRTRRFRTLTYARAQSEAEDVTFFSRERKRNIAIYASPQKLASRGAFYNEDDLHRVRRPRLRHRHRRRARPRVADRPRRDPAAGQGVRARRADADPGRHLHHLVDHQQGAGPAAVPARAQPERRGRQPAVAAVARLRADPDRALPGPHRAAVDRLRVDRRRTGRRSGPTRCRWCRASATGCSATARTGTRSRASPTTRGRRCASRCRSSSAWRPRAWPRRRSRRSWPARPGRPLALHLLDLPPGALPRRRGQQDGAGSTRPRWPSTSSSRRRRRRRARSPWRSCWPGRRRRRSAAATPSTWW